MAFWTHMLHCAARSFYVAHTDALGGGLAQHVSARPGGYASSRRPVKRVWAGGEGFDELSPNGQESGDQQ